MTRFEHAWSFTTSEEGGTARDPRDHGGLTQSGITDALYARWREMHGLDHRPVTSSTPEERKDVAYELVWTPARCELLWTPAHIPHFDFAFNAGSDHAIRVLQAVLGLKIDGQFGPMTTTEAERRLPDVLAHDLVSARRGYHLKATIDDHTQAAFLSDWVGRCDRLEAFIAETDVVG